MWWILKKLFKMLFMGRASTLIGGLGGKQLAAVATALLGTGGSKLSALVGNFQSAGLGHLVETWIGKGANHAVTGEEVKSAVGSDAISGIAAELGVSDEEAATKVAGLLPQLVDKLTPDGSVPDEQELAKRLRRLLKAS
jgi:uncharacterized protein YidB (DUF937 family)